MGRGGGGLGQGQELTSTEEQMLLFQNILHLLELCCRGV